jgi:hypothetical protein
MIESFLYGTWICGQVLYWFFLRHETALLGEECWRMLNILTCRDVQRGERHPGIRSALQLSEFETRRS